MELHRIEVGVLTITLEHFSGEGDGADAGHKNVSELIGRLGARGEPISGCFIHLPRERSMTVAVASTSTSTSRSRIARAWSSRGWAELLIRSRLGEPSAGVTVNPRILCWLMAHDNAVLRVALQKMSLSADDRRKRDLILDAFKVSLAAPLQERAAEVIGKLDNR